MENREILIGVTSTQRKYKVITDVTTLGALKGILNSNEGVFVMQGGEWIPNATPIDYTNMTFTEGYTNTELLSDDSQLPSNVMHQGRTTNNLIMILTNTKKKIQSGAMSRSEAYAKIKEYNLQETIVEVFGRNYTQVPTNSLVEMIEKYDDTLNNNDLDDEDYDDEDVNDNEPEETPQVATWTDDNSLEDNVVDALYIQIKALVENEFISEMEVVKLVNKLAADIQSSSNETAEMVLDPTTGLTLDAFDELMTRMS